MLSTFIASLGLAKFLLTFLYVDLGCISRQVNKNYGGSSITCWDLGLEFISFVFW